MASHLMLPILIHLLLLNARYTSATAPPFSFEIDIDDINIDDDNGFNPYSHKVNLATLVLAVILMVVFLFIALFSILCRRSPVVHISNAAPPLPVSSSFEEIRSGLDPAAIDAFPILTYSAAAALKIGKETLECAICLCDFTEEEHLRMLPNCCHVFHPECVGSWLEYHVTCPVCRDDLAVVPTEKSGPRRMRGEWSVDLEMDLEMELDLGRRGRSQSMGEVMKKDRHRLVLPEHVMRELVDSGGLRRCGEVAVFKGSEDSARRGFRGLSDRWTAVILNRVFNRGDGSVRKGNPDDGGGKDNSEEEAGCSNVVTEV